MSGDREALGRMERARWALEERRAWHLKVRALVAALDASDAAVAARLDPEPFAAAMSGEGFAELERLVQAGPRPWPGTA